MVSQVMHTTIGIRADGLRSRLECSRWRRRCKSIEFGEGINAKKTTKKVQICSKIKIDNFYSILIKVESSRLNDAQMVDVAAMIELSPMTNSNTSSMSSQRHRTRHPMKARCGGKSVTPRS